MNLVHWLLPIFTVKRRVDKLNREYEDVLHHYSAKPNEIKGQKPFPTYTKEAHVNQKEFPESPAMLLVEKCDESNDIVYNPNAAKTIRRY